MKFGRPTPDPRKTLEERNIQPTPTTYADPKKPTRDQNMGRVKRIWYLSPMRAAKVLASLRIRAVSPEPPLLAHTGFESRGTFRQKARSLAPLTGWAYAVKICHDGMLKDTNSLDPAQMVLVTSNTMLHDYHRKKDHQPASAASIECHRHIKIRPRTGMYPTTA